MRTGAIFARGSCRALKWMALFGVMFALGVGTTAAQVTVTVADKVDEGATVTLTVGGTVSIPDGTGAQSVTVGATVAAGTASGMVTAGEGSDLLGMGQVAISTPPNDDGDGDANEHTLSGTFTWAVGTDLDAEDEAVVLTFTASASGGLSVVAPTDTKAVTIEDTHTQMFDWGPEPELKEGGTAMITLTADPSPTSGGLTHDTTLVVEGATGYTIAPTSHTFDFTNPSVSLTITAPGNDGNRVDDTIMLRALEAGTVTDRAAPLSITVGDNNKLPTVTAKLTNEDGDPVPAEGVTEGDVVMLTFEVEDDATEDITITLTEAAANTAMADDYSLDEMEATIASGATASDMLTLTTMSNDDIMNDMLVLTGAVMGADANGTTAGDPVMVMLTIMDDTMINITTKTDAEVQAAVDAQIAEKSKYGGHGVYTADSGGLDFTASDFFNLPGTDFGVSVTAVSDDPAVWAGVSGMNITVDGRSPGMATITVTAIVAPPAGARVNQISANSASVMFDIEVHKIPAPGIMAKSDKDVMDAYMAARTAAAGDDGVWASNDGPATIMLDMLFDNLPATGVSADATSSMASVLVASVSSSTVVLTPIGAGDSNVTVTANGVSLTFMASVDPIPVPGLDMRGRITAFSIAGTEERTLDGVKRMHLTEGGITTASVTVTWTNQQLTALWDGYTAANPPPPAMVNLYDTSFVEDAAVGTWLSLAETNERDGSGSRGGNDVVWGAQDIEVKIPKKPTKNTDSATVTASATGTTSVSLPHDDDAEPEAFRVRWWEAASSGVKYEGTLMYGLLTATTHVIEDDEPQGIKLTQTTKDPIYEGGGTITFTAVADPAREDLPLDVRYDLTDSSGVSVSSGTYTVDSSIGTVPIGPSGKDTVVLNVARNDGDRMDDMLQMHAEVVTYALDTGAYGDVGSKMVDFTVIDVHKLPPVTVMPETATLMEGKELELTVTVDRNPRETRAVDPEVLPYTTEELSIMVMASGATGEYSLSSTAITVPEYKHKAGDDELAAAREGHGRGPRGRGRRRGLDADARLRGERHRGRQRAQRQ